MMFQKVELALSANFSSRWVHKNNRKMTTGYLPGGEILLGVRLLVLNFFEKDHDNSLREGYTFLEVSP